MLADGSMRAYRQLPAESRKRGLPSIGFEVELPDGIDVTVVDNGATVVRCREARGGRTIGELEIALSPAALVIDRDGILEQKASEAIEHDRGRVEPPVAVVLAGASGYRAGVEAIGRERPALPYTYAFAMAPHDLVADGCLIVTLRCARHDWPAAEQMMCSLQVFTRKPSANDAARASSIETTSALPLVGRDDDR